MRFRQHVPVLALIAAGALSGCSTTGQAAERGPQPLAAPAAAASDEGPGASEARQDHFPPNDNAPRIGSTGNDRAACIRYAAAHQQYERGQMSRDDVGRQKDQAKAEAASDGMRTALDQRFAAGETFSCPDSPFELTPPDVSEQPPVGQQPAARANDNKPTEVR